MTLTAATPVRLDELLDVDHLDYLVKRRLVSCRAHPDLDLRIYDYTRRASYAGAWDHEMRLCRGLIVDGAGYVAGRPFAKFFTLDEHLGHASVGALPVERPMEVFEKLDGSLGILYDAAGAPGIATRGSFDSPQARWATEHYRSAYGTMPVPPGVTYLFEIIYPGNRLIVDYGSLADLVLLAAIDNATGADRPLPPVWPGPVMMHHSELTDLAAVTGAAARGGVGEGFVLRFAPSAPDQPSVRVKVKFDEYLRVHRLLTAVTARTIWDHLAAGRALDELVDGAPDAFAAWVGGVADGLRVAFATLEAECRAALADVGVGTTDRRAIAASVERLGERAPIIFKMLDRRPYDQLIWRAIRPAGDVSFRPDLDW